MTASRSARERRTADQAGPLAEVRVELDARRQLVHKIRCTTCTTKGGRRWSSYRPGEDNGYLAAMDRWTFHLAERHPGSDAPCLAFLPAAQQRLQERRDAAGTGGAGTAGAG